MIVLGRKLIPHLKFCKVRKKLTLVENSEKVHGGHFSTWYSLSAYPNWLTHQLWAESVINAVYVPCQLLVVHLVNSSWCSSSLSLPLLLHSLFPYSCFLAPLPCALCPISLPSLFQTPRSRPRLHFPALPLLPYMSYLFYCVCPMCYVLPVSVILYSHPTLFHFSIGERREGKRRCEQLISTNKYGG